MSDRIMTICRKHDLQIKKKFTEGNICKNVYLVQKKKGPFWVLKVGENDRTIKEIGMNIIGYNKLIKIGLGNFIPFIIDSQIDNNFAFILMEYCGPNFLTLSRQTEEPLHLFHKLARELEGIYFQSLIPSLDAQQMINNVVNKVVEQYDKYLRPFDSGKILQNQITALSKFSQSLALKFSCFSSWDFTPEDIYLPREGIKYGDPKQNVLGVPIIDLACFAGVTRDAYFLPGSISGYKLLYNFAVKKVAPLLAIPIKTARKIFFLGRVLQCFLSARFRITSETQLALKNFQRGKQYLRKIINY